MRKLRILLADDHAVIRQGLKLLVDAQPDMEVIGEAGDGQEAWQKAKELQPDVVVMDISMPECNGAQATERLAAECPASRCWRLTLYEDEEYLRQLLQAGASGYVLKRAAAEELTQAIRTVAAGGVYLDPNMAGKVVGGYIGKPVPAEERQPAPATDLSEREAEVLLPHRMGLQQQRNRRAAPYQRQDRGNLQNPPDGKTGVPQPRGSGPLCAASGMAAREVKIRSPSSLALAVSLISRKLVFPTPVREFPDSASVKLRRGAGALSRQSSPSLQPIPWSVSSASRRP